jgi:hypothetical protein
MLQDLLSKYATEAEKQTYLQQLVKEHPYFTPAQFCLLQSTPVEEVVYAQRAATTALLFNNAGWLNYQLHHQFKETAAVAPIEAILPAEEPTPALQNEVIAPAATIPDETMMAVPEMEEIQPPISQTNTNNIEDSAEIEKMAEPLNVPLPIPGPGKHDSELLFEPLYAVDYFASQGIKLSEELQSGDKLGKQLKSFTDWLKSMKKTQAQTAEEPVLPASDPAIQYIAEKSNKEGDVVTEAMALVYAQQGNIKKAITIYQKLSLLNPPKSAYFAAKIENLK